MANENPTGRDSLDPSSPAGESRGTESAVLALLLTEHPIQLTMPELALILHGDIDLFKPTDAAECGRPRTGRRRTGDRRGRFLYADASSDLFRHPGDGFTHVAARFGDNPRAAASWTDLSQDELSVRASVHRTEISQLERGLRIPRSRHVGQNSRRH